jgi:hypothetical protein
MIPFALSVTRRPLTLARAATIALALATGSATFAQPASSPPGPPPAGGLKLPPGAGGAPPGGIPGVPPGPVLTPAQKIVADLPPPTPGALPPRPPLPAGSVMPSSDPRDFQGTWFHNQILEFRSQKDMYGAALPYTMEGAKVIARRVKSLADGKPFINASAICRPPGAQWQYDLNFPFLITQGKDYVSFLFEEYHGRWNITLDPQAMPLPVQKQYMGKSVGHWDGDTLVVETTDFKQAIWLDVDGTPLSANGKLIQRIRRVSNGDETPFLEIATTVFDPTYYTKSWSIVRTFGWVPHQAVFSEYNCEEQVGDPGVPVDAGLVPEPVE